MPLDLLFQQISKVEALDETISQRKIRFPSSHAKRQPHQGS
jgi:hypothetical protein